jgi:hypothetical protein
MGRVSIGGLIYIGLGFFVAISQGYLSNLSSIPNLLSAILAILLWPLLLFGINLHLVF